MNTNVEFSIEAFQAGKDKAFAYIDKLYRSPLLVSAGFMTRNGEQAEDIVQDSFIKLWSKRAGFNTLHDIGAFLNVTVRNACLDYLRHGKVIKDNEAGITHYLSTTGNWAVELPFEEKERIEIERLALQMYADDASPEVKYYLENNVSSKEAGDSQGILPHTLRRMARKCIGQLREKLGLR